MTESSSADSAGDAGAAARRSGHDGGATAGSTRTAAPSDADPFGIGGLARTAEPTGEVRAPDPSIDTSGVGAEAADDGASDALDDGESPRRKRSGARGRRPREWYDGGTSVRRWGWELFGWGCLALGLGVLASAAAAIFVGGSLGRTLGTVALWIAFAAPVVFGLARSRPRGLLRFSPADLLYGVVLGVTLRIAQGWLEIAAGGTGAWPTYTTLDGSLPPTWAFEELVGGVVVAPVLEELFFRGLVLVAIYSAVRRMTSRGLAAFVATIASTALFVIAHAALAPVPWNGIVSLALLGLVASAVVLLTGRIWTAVLVHVVYNASWVALATVGTLLSA